MSLLLYTQGLVECLRSTAYNKQTAKLICVSELLNLLEMEIRATKLFPLGAKDAS